MTENIEGVLAGYISDKILKQSTRLLHQDDPLITSGLIDSFSLVDLALFIEDNFNVIIDDTELNSDTFNTLAQLADLIRSRQ